MILVNLNEHYKLGLDPGKYAINENVQTAPSVDKRLTKLKEKYPHLKASIFFSTEKTHFWSRSALLETSIFN